MSTHYQRNGKKDLITSIGGNAGGYIFKKIYNLFNKKIHLLLLMFVTMKVLISIFTQIYQLNRINYNFKNYHSQKSCMNLSLVT